MTRKTITLRKRLRSHPKVQITALRKITQIPRSLQMKEEGRRTETRSLLLVRIRTKIRTRTRIRTAQESIISETESLMSA